MADRITIEPVAPIATRTVMAFVSREDGCGGMEPVTVQDFPPGDGALIRRLRSEYGLYLHEAARALGVSLVEMSGLEHNKYRANYDEIDRRLRDAARRKG